MVEKTAAVRAQFLEVESQTLDLNEAQRETLRTAPIDCFAEMSADRRVQKSLCGP